MRGSPRAEALLIEGTHNGYYEESPRQEGDGEKGSEGGEARPEESVREEGVLREGGDAVREEGVREEGGQAGGEEARGEEDGEEGEVKPSSSSGNKIPDLPPLGRSGIFLGRRRASPFFGG